MRLPTRLGRVALGFRFNRNGFLLGALGLRVSDLPFLGPRDSRALGFFFGMWWRVRFNIEWVHVDPWDEADGKFQKGRVFTKTPQW